MFVWLSRLALLGIVLCGIAISGCSHADYSSIYASPTPTATAVGSATATASSSASASPTSTASLTPAACGTPLANSVYIAIGSYIEDESPVDPTYGELYGYALVDSAGDYPLQSGPIQLKPADVIQFVNVDPAAASGTNGTSHSAAGFSTASFPTNYAFSSAALVPTGSALTNTALWSTGEIPAVADVLCYSQPITVPGSGTYYFGDVDFYNLNGMRDVIVVSSSAPQRKSARPHRRR